MQDSGGAVGQVPAVGGSTGAQSLYVSVPPPQTGSGRLKPDGPSSLSDSFLSLNDPALCAAAPGCKSQLGASLDMAD